LRGREGQGAEKTRGEGRGEREREIVRREGGGDGGVEMRERRKGRVGWRRVEVVEGRWGGVEDVERI